MSTLPAPFIYIYDKTPAGEASLCRIQFFTAPTGEIVVVCTEMPDNPGVSTTNCADEIFAAIVQDYQLEPERVVWIEHHHPRPFLIYGQASDTYARVIFYENGHKLDKPQWQYLSGEELSFLTGGALTV